MKTPAAIIAAVLISGCSHHYEYYDYSDAQVRTDTGILHVFMRGSFTEVRQLPQTTERASPYHLVLSFETPDPPGEPIKLQLNELQVGSSSHQSMLQLKATSTEAREGKSWAYLVVDKLTLEHEPVMVRGTFEYKGKIHAFSVYLEPRRSSEWRSNWFDALMSV